MERYGIDLYGQLRWYELDEAANHGLKKITAGTFPSSSCDPRGSLESSAERARGDRRSQAPSLADAVTTEEAEA
jgi:hypothetical protein